VWLVSRRGVCSPRNGKGEEPSSFATVDLVSIDKKNLALIYVPVRGYTFILIPRPIGYSIFERYPYPSKVVELCLSAKLSLG
jgi:hypothetical protein